jgi:hypothetical protein
VQPERPADADCGRESHDATWGHSSSLAVATKRRASEWTTEPQAALNTERVCPAHKPNGAALARLFPWLDVPMHAAGRASGFLFFALPL